MRSQRELLQASAPDPHAGAAVPALDVDVNELALVYRARGMSEAEAAKHADEILGKHTSAMTGQFGFAATDSAEHEAIGTGLRAAVSSFCFFASGALVPVLPYLIGLQGVVALVVAAVLVGIALIGELAGVSTKDEAFQLAMVISAGSAHRREVWTAWAAQGRTGRWSEIIKCGAKIHADQLDRVTAYRHPRPIEHKQEHRDGMVFNIAVDPEDVVA